MSADDAIRRCDEVNFRLSNIDPLDDQRPVAERELGEPQIEARDFEQIDFPAV